MLSNFTLAQLNQVEDDLIRTFQQHRCFQQIMDLPTTRFLEILLQRRFLSLAFTPIYDLAIDGLLDNMARQVARRILREEYPGERGNIPSHREDLVTDLLVLGISRHQVINSQPTAQTLQALQQSIAFLTGNLEDPLYQVKLLTFLRFWGEVLVAAEYEMLWKRMEAMGLSGSGEKRSRFYYPHLVHDAKKKSLAQLSLTGSTHSDQLAISLKAVLQNAASLHYCAEVTGAIVALKTQFYDQFL